MANAMTFAQLEQARAMITAGNLAGFYEYMESQGYNYAYRGEGIVKQDTLAGTEAFNYLVLTAQKEGVNLSGNPILVIAIETSLANAWISALEAVAADSTNTSHTVSADLDFQQTLAFHQTIFQQFGIQSEAWTLDIPSQILSPTVMEQTWEGFLVSAQPGINRILLGRLPLV